MEKIVNHNLKNFTNDIDIYKLDRDFIIYKIKQIKSELSKLKYKRDDKSISDEEYFSKEYLKLYDLELLSRFELASRILGSKDIKEINIKRKETILDYPSENIWESEHVKVLYNGYIKQGLINEKETKLSQLEIEDLVSKRKLVLNPDYIKLRENQISNNSKPLNYHITLPYITNNNFTDYDLKLLSETYPEITNDIRYSLTFSQMDKDISNFDSMFLSDLYEKARLNIKKSTKKLSVIIEETEKDVKILSKNMNTINDIRSSI